MGGEALVKKPAGLGVKRGGAGGMAGNAGWLCGYMAIWLYGYMAPS